MPKRPYVIAEMISAKSIAARIETLSREIHTEFATTDKLIVVGLLRGSFVFIADLVRELDLPIEVDFLEASSYGDGTESSREVRILKDLRGAIEGRDVLVVEDIVDTGHIVAFDEGLKFKLSKVGKSWTGSFLGGEGIVCRFSGKGTVWCQSHSPANLGNALGRLLKPIEVQE